MRLVPEVFGLYLVITNPTAGYEACADAAVRAGLAFIQLRMKHCRRDEILKKAKALRSVTAGSNTLFIVNDDPSVAAECGADGVHLGQTDMDIGEARRLYPELSVFGLSTHNPAQEHAACALSPDYIGIGPVFATPTKEKPDPTLGAAEAGRMAIRARSRGIPSVAIGGVNGDNIDEVVAAGALNFAVVRAVCGATDPYGAIVSLTDKWLRALEKAGRIDDLEKARAFTRAMKPLSEKQI